jgi:hypothetical protein
MNMKTKCLFLEGFYDIIIMMPPHILILFNPILALQANFTRLATLKARVG